jgi:hypothetical protein
VTGAPNATLVESAPPPVAGPANGDFAAGLAGWTVLGPSPPPIGLQPDGGLAVSLGLDTTIVSPPFVVPPGVQAVAIVARSPGLGASLDVRAQPALGGLEVPLATLQPTSAFTAQLVPLDGLAGQTVSLVLDPVPSLGRGVDVRAVGPFQTVLPEWMPVRGLPVLGAAGGRRVLDVRDDLLQLASLPFAPGPAAVGLLVSVLGDGRVTADAGAGAVSAGGLPRWQDVVVPLPRGVPAAALRLTAVPGRGGLRLANLGLVVRASVLRDLRVGRVDARGVVAGRIAPAGSGLLVELRGAAGRLGSARTDALGRFRIVARAPGGRALLVVRGDRTRRPARVGLRLPGLRRSAMGAPAGGR